MSTRCRDEASRGRYVQGCRCADCRVKNTEYGAAYQEICRRYTGAPKRVPVDSDLLAHLAKLARQGMGYRAVARAAEVSQTTVQAIRNGTRASTSAETRAAIMAVRSDPFWVPTVGLGRRLRALAWMGYSQAVLAQRSGTVVAVIQDLMADITKLARHDNAARICAAYDELWQTPGPSKRSRNHAIRHGWAPPMAWDDDTIDDPKAKPVGMRTEEAA